MRSSWNLLPAYTGHRWVVENMTYTADYWIDDGLSGHDAAWANLPCKADLHSGVHDGNTREGKGLHEPHKAASFAAELVLFYKVAGDVRQMKVATEFADTPARKIVPRSHFKTLFRPFRITKLQGARGGFETASSDNDHSPWPHRVHAETGEVRLPYMTNHTGAYTNLDDRQRVSTGSIQLPLDEVMQ